MLTTHPARLMLRVWVYCWLTFLILPYQLTTNKLTVYGIFVLLLFMAAFWIGTACVKVPADSYNGGRMPLLDDTRANRVLEIASLIAIIGFSIDISSKNVLDLAASSAARNDASAAMLAGEQSSSSIGFQIAFLFYPAAYVYIANHVIFREKIDYKRLLFFGYVPAVQVALSMGGRATLFYAMLIGVISMAARRRYFGVPKREKAKSSSRRKLLTLAVIAAFVAAGYYFSAVFLARADVAGGAEAMFDIAEANWGVGFRGPMSSTIFSVLGQGMTYIVFVTIWYMIQGIVMSNIIFTKYAGPAQLTVYGLDISSGVMRRVDNQFVTQGFNALQNLGTFGFLPTAWGSLYVDFYMFGLVFAWLWGYWASVVCRNIRLAQDARWLIVGPFVALGIVFSVINTPLGFSNGFITHCWLLVAFRMLRKPSPNTSREAHVTANIAAAV